MEENHESVASPVEATLAAIEKLEEARDAVRHVVEARAANKLSFSRPANVAREINDLIKVMTVCIREHVAVKL